MRRVSSRDSSGPAIGSVGTCSRSPDALPLLRAGRPRVGQLPAVAAARRHHVGVDRRRAVGRDRAAGGAGGRHQAARHERDSRRLPRRHASRSAPAATVSADTVQEMREVAELIVGDVAGNVHSALALNDLANADGYTLKHSLAVTTLGLSLGAARDAEVWLDRRPRQAALRRHRGSPGAARCRAAAARHRQAGRAAEKSCASPDR